MKLHGRAKNGLQVTHRGTSLPLHWVTSFLGSFSSPVSGARSAQEIEFPANFFTSRHSVDHDIGQGWPTFSPSSQAVAVEPDAMEPLQSLLGVLSL